MRGGAAYDVVEVEAGGVGSAAESDHEDLVKGVSDDGVDLPFCRQRWQHHRSHLSLSLVSFARSYEILRSV